MIDVQQRRGASKVIARTLMYLILLVAALLAILPFYWAVAGSLMSPAEIYSQIPHLWPPHPDFGSYLRIFQLVPMGQYFFNSMLTSVITMVVATLVSSAAGYTFAQLRFFGSRFWFVLILATLMVPYQSRLVPLFVMANNYGLFDTYAGIVLPGLASAFGLFMMAQFFRSVPSELREAALMDGAREIRIFFQIYLPLARPAVATLALLMFLQSWDQLLWPLIIAPRPDMRTLQVGLAFITQYAPTINYQLAAIIISVIPIVVAFFLAQRQFIEGIAAGAVKQ